MARDYPLGVQGLPHAYYDYNKLKILWGDPFFYTCCTKLLGRGTYADVYLGHLTGNVSQRVVIKHLKHSTWYKIKREVLAMQAVHGHPNIMKLLAVVPHLKLRPQHASLRSNSSSSSRHLHSLDGGSAQEEAPGLMGLWANEKTSEGGQHTSGGAAARVLCEEARREHCLYVRGGATGLVEGEEGGGGSLPRKDAGADEGDGRMLSGLDGAGRGLARGEGLIALTRRLKEEEEEVGEDVEHSEADGRTRNCSNCNAVAVSKEGRSRFEKNGRGDEGEGNSREAHNKASRFEGRIRSRVLQSARGNDRADERGLARTVKELLAGRAMFEYVGADSKQPVSFILEAVQAMPYEKLLEQITLSDAKRYTRQLVEALQHAHSHGIMHRDVKIDNTLISHAEKRLVLADWGLAEFYFPRQSYKYTVSTQAYKAPELLLKYRKYNFAIDMWGVGVHLGGYVFQRKHVFGYADSERGMLEGIARVQGSEGLEQLIRKYSMRRPEGPPMPSFPKLSFTKAFRLKPGLATPECLDFIEQLLQYDPEKRLTASEALRHPFLLP